MLTTILDELINGWVLTVFLEDGKQAFIYERLQDAQEHRIRIEINSEYKKRKEVLK